MKVIFRIPNKGTIEKPKYSNPSPIIVRASQGKSIQLSASTGFEVDPKYWILPDQKKKIAAIAKAKKHGKPKPKFIVDQGLTKIFKPQKLTRQEIQDDVKVLSRITLDELKVHIVKAFEKAYANSVSINSAWLKDVILEFRGQKRSDDTSLFSYHFARFINVKGVKRFQPILDRVNDYDSELALIDVDDSFSHKYGAYLRKKKFRPGYILQELSHLRRVLRYAEKKGETITKIDVDDWHKPKKTKIEKSFDVVFLSEEKGEIAAIEKLDLSKNPILDNTKRVLLLSCFTGQRYSDLKKLSFDKIDADDNIEIKQMKTDKRVVVPILPKTKKILKRGVKIVALPLYIHRVKEVCRLAGINEKVKGKTRGKDQDKIEHEKWELIGSHVGRRSFASNHYNKLKTGELMDLTGHSKEETFMRYIGKTKKESAKAFHDYYKKKKKK